MADEGIDQARMEAGSQPHVVQLLQASTDLLRLSRELRERADELVRQSRSARYRFAYPGRSSRAAALARRYGRA